MSCADMEPESRPVPCVPVLVAPAAVCAMIPVWEPLSGELAVAAPPGLFEALRGRLEELGAWHDDHPAG
ncbi:hypothetical protein GTY57_04610 [Streptomyces sp. SID5475]|nr:hypothetical protein [Streptomyces sp. SID5475]